MDPRGGVDPGGRSQGRSRGGTTRESRTHAGLEPMVDPGADSRQDSSGPGPRGRFRGKSSGANLWDRSRSSCRMLSV